MNRPMHPSGKFSGSQYESQMKRSEELNSNYKATTNGKEMEEDLIIEDNTIYEIDRDCYERLKRQRKKR